MSVVHQHHAAHRARSWDADHAADINPFGAQSGYNRFSPGIVADRSDKMRLTTEPGKRHSRSCRRPSAGVHDVFGNQSLVR
jgi:hypothetical protein